MRPSAAVATGSQSVGRWSGAESPTRSIASATAWLACVGLGAGLLGAAILSLSPADWASMGLPLAMMVILIVISELRPIATHRTASSPVSISLAFVFAAMYLWGPAVAIVLIAGSTALADVFQRRSPWRLAFRLSVNVLSLAAAWSVLALGGGRAAPTSPTVDPSAWGLPWLVASWVAYHLIGVALTATAALAPTATGTWWQAVTDQFWFHAGATAAVLALSPMVAIVAGSYERSWLLLPLLMVPLLAVQRNAEHSREREYRTLHDPLTGLPNRAMFTDRLEAELAADPSRGPVALVLLDLDHFKLVNDALGHQAGDALLVTVAGRLRPLMGSGQTLARLSGDEFAVLCSRGSSRDVEGLIEHMRTALREPFEYEQREIALSASIGLVRAAPGVPAMSLVRQADAAMNRAKVAGRDRVSTYDERRDPLPASLLDDHLGLRDALEREELRAHYQPVVDMRTDEVVGVEALVRWQRPGRGLLGAKEIVPLAEDTGLIEAVGGWMIERTLHQLRDWRIRGVQPPSLWVAVNLSAQQISDPALLDQIRSLLGRYRIPPQSLHLEITETSVMRTIDSADNLDALTALGVSLIVDDFGTGHSSLARLKGLPVTAVKIDRSFIEDLATNEPDRSIVDAIAAMSRSMNLDVIAEGVTTPEQRDILLSMGVRFGQGYLWVPPLSGPDLADWLRARPAGATSKDAGSSA